MLQLDCVSGSKISSPLVVASDFLPGGRAGQVATVPSPLLSPMLHAPRCRLASPQLAKQTPENKGGTGLEEGGAGRSSFPVQWLLTPSTLPPLQAGWGGGAWQLWPSRNCSTSVASVPQRNLPRKQPQGKTPSVLRESRPEKSPTLSFCQLASLGVQMQRNLAKLPREEPGLARQDTRHGRMNVFNPGTNQRLLT